MRGYSSCEISKTGQSTACHSRTHGAPVSGSKKNSAYHGKHSRHAWISSFSVQGKSNGRTGSPRCTRFFCDGMTTSVPRPIDKET